MLFYMYLVLIKYFHMLIAYSMIVQEKKKVNYQQSDLCQLVD